MPVQNGKKTEKLLLSSKEAEISSDEETSDEEDPDFEPSDDHQSTDGTESATGGEESEAEDAKRKASVLKKKLLSKKKNQKRKLEVDDEQNAEPKKVKKVDVLAKPAKPAKKQTGGKKSAKKEEEKPAATKTDDDKGEEKAFKVDSLPVEDKDKEEKKGGGRKQAPMFNDKNLDYNLYRNDPENVVAKRIKVSNSVLICCKMIDISSANASGTALAYDYAALTIQKKVKDQKAFEFNLPLSLAPNIIEALKLIIKDNPKFFAKHGNGTRPNKTDDYATIDSQE